MALSRVLERRTDRTMQMVDGESWYMDWVERDYDHLTGWKSDVTGEFYAADEGQMAPQSVYGLAGNRNEQYVYTTENQLQLKEVEFTNARETARIQADYQAQRDQWAAQETQVRATAAAEQLAAEQAVRDQQAAFDAATTAREAAAEAARVKAEELKAATLAGEQRINSKTLLETMERISSVRDNDIVAAEDKKVLGAEDKAQLFSAGQQDEEEKKKAKSTILERILGSSPAGTPNAKL